MGAPSNLVLVIHAKDVGTSCMILHHNHYRDLHTPYQGWVSSRPCPHHQITQYSHCSQLSTSWLGMKIVNSPPRNFPSRNTHHLCSHEQGDRKRSGAVSRGQCILSSLSSRRELSAMGSLSPPLCLSPIADLSSFGTYAERQMGGVGIVLTCRSKA